MLAEKKAKAKTQAQGQGEDSGDGKAPGIPAMARRYHCFQRPRYLPPLYELIEGGKVLALNMPAGSNPALARAIGVMLKNAWLQALLMRPGADERIPHGLTFGQPSLSVMNIKRSRRWARTIQPAMRNPLH